MRRAPPLSSAQSPTWREAARRFLGCRTGRRRAILLEQEYWLFVAREPSSASAYLARCARLRTALADALARARPAARTPELPMPTIEVATAYVALIDGLARPS